MTKKTAFFLPENAKDMFEYAGRTEEKLSKENIFVPVIVIRLLFLTVNNVRVFWVIHPKDYKPNCFRDAVNVQPQLFMLHHL